mgnify:CR=1 FL=1
MAVREHGHPRKLRRLCHSLMLVLLNGGHPGWRFYRQPGVPLADACVTEWRRQKHLLRLLGRTCHSLMLVLLNGGHFF